MDKKKSKNVVKLINKSRSYKLINNNFFYYKKKLQHKIKLINKEYYINLDIDDNDLNHIFLRISYSLKKGCVVYLYINSIKSTFIKSTINQFIDRVSNLIKNKLGTIGVLKINSKGYFFIIRR